MTLFYDAQAQPPGPAHRRWPLGNWPGWLEAVGLLSPGLRESYRRTLEGFDQFCRKRAHGQATSGTPGSPARLTVALAREYVELTRLEWTTGS